MKDLSFPTHHCPELLKIDPLLFFGRTEGSSVVTSWYYLLRPEISYLKDVLIKVFPMILLFLFSLPKAQWNVHRTFSKLLITPMVWAQLVRTMMKLLGGLDNLMYITSSGSERSSKIPYIFHITFILFFCISTLEQLSVRKLVGRKCRKSELFATHC